MPKYFVPKTVGAVLWGGVTARRAYRVISRMYPEQDSFSRLPFRHNPALYPLPLKFVPSVSEWSTQVVTVTLEVFASVSKWSLFLCDYIPGTLVGNL